MVCEPEAVPGAGLVTSRARVRGAVRTPLRRGWGAFDEDSIARPAGSPVRAMELALSARVLEGVDPSGLPRRSWAMGERRRSASLVMVS